MHRTLSAETVSEANKWTVGGNTETSEAELSQPKGDEIPTLSLTIDQLLLRPGLILITSSDADSGELSCGTLHSSTAPGAELPTHGILCTLRDQTDVQGGLPDEHSDTQTLGANPGWDEVGEFRGVVLPGRKQAVWGAVFPPGVWGSWM